MNPAPITFTAIKVVQPIGEFIIGNITAADLVGISFADVRRIEDEQREVEKYLGIQRPLDKVRVKQIKKYLDAPDASFPTGVVLAVHHNCAEFDQANSRLTLKSYDSDYSEDSIVFSKIAKVLDGQHRIAAFMSDNGGLDVSMGNIVNTFQFNVVIFVGLDVDEQANIFATVNLAQTKVNKSLVYDLEGLSKTRSPFRTCHQIAVALDTVDPSSPLYHRIKRLGVKTKGRDTTEPLTQAAFVESLLKLISPYPSVDRTLYMKRKVPDHVYGEELKKYPFRNLFLDEQDNKIVLILFNYFKAVERKWPVAWRNIDLEGNILPRSNAFKALMRFLRIAYIKAVDNNIGDVPGIDSFAWILGEVNASDNDFTSGNFLPGSGGEAAFFKLLKGEVTIRELKNQTYP